jgi:peptide deformylase
MALRKIAQLGEPVLRQVARRLADEEISSSRVGALVDDMIDTMRDADGAGLAAPQVYESIALVVIEVRENTRYPDVDPIPLTVLANPTITPIVSTPLDALADCDAILAYEGCLSVPGLRGRVRRPRKVRVQAVDPTTGRRVDEVWEGFRAVVVQHETDHLTGTLFVDRADTHSLSFLREYDRYVARDARVIDLGVPPAGNSR